MSTLEESAPVRWAAVYYEEVSTSFIEYFEPLFTEGHPIPLSPIGCGVCLFFQGLEFLILNEIQTICIVTLQKHYAKYQQALQHILETHPLIRTQAASVTIKCLSINQSTLTAGDAIREFNLEFHPQDPFLMMSMNAFSLANIKPILQLHLERQKLQPQQLLTIILSKASFGGSFQNEDQDALVMYDENTHELLCFEYMKKKKYFRITNELLKKKSEKSEIKIQYGLIDPHLVICSPAVATRFAEAFDLKDFVKDLFSDVFSNEILNEKLFVSILMQETHKPDSLSTQTCLNKNSLQNAKNSNNTFSSFPRPNFVFRVSDPRTYHYLCRLLLDLKMYMFDSTMAPISYSQYTLETMGHNSCGATNAMICRHGPTAIIACNVVIQENTRIENSFIARNCKIGKGVKIENSVLFENVIIEDHAQINASILSYGVRIGSGSIIHKGSILGHGVQIAPSTVLQEFSKISLLERSSSLQDNFEKKYGKSDLAMKSKNALSQGSNGVVWTVGCASRKMFQAPGGNILTQIPLPLPQHPDDSESELDLHDEDDDSCGSIKGEQDEDEEFFTEICALASEAIAKPEEMQYKLMEMKVLRFTTNKTDQDILFILFRHLITLLIGTLPPTKADWLLFSEEHKVKLLLSEFCLKQPDEAYIHLLEIVYEICLLSEICVENLNEVVVDEERNSKSVSSFMWHRLINPALGPKGFCSLCEILNHCEFVEPQYIVRWYERACCDSKYDEAIITYPRLQAFISFLNDDDSSEDEQ